MTTLVHRAATPYRELHGDLARLPDEDLAELTRDSLPLYDRPRAERFAVGAVAVAIALAGKPMTPAAALEWFLGPLTPALRRALTDFGALDHRPDIVPMLPYVLDPFGDTTRRAVLHGRSDPAERASRKRLGTFYTPGDVARALASEVVTPNTRSVVDPACGAGVFLRAAFTELSRFTAPDSAVRKLHGVDIDPVATDATSLVLTHDWIARVPLEDDELPIHRFHRVRGQVICADALQYFSPPLAQRSLFDSQPVRSHDAKFDGILMNPPFATVGKVDTGVANEYASLRASANPAGVSLAWPFWELSARLCATGGRAGVVLPLSAAHATSLVAQATREQVLRDGTWHLRFYDRTPDALFGDDVKQRVTLAVRFPGDGQTVVTSAMRRWAADARTAALAPLATGARQPVSGRPILKIGSETELDAVRHLRSLGGTLGGATIRATSATPDELPDVQTAIVVNPTAYNWIGAFRDPSFARASRIQAQSRVSLLEFPNAEMADAAYALLSSQVFLWWWRAVGDLFHVSLTTITRSPFPLHLVEPEELAALAQAGRLGWEAARASRVVATNKGVQTVAYRMPADSDALRSADHAAARAFGLTEDFVHFARHDAMRLQVAGRNWEHDAANR